MRQREGGREGEVIPRVWENTVATEGMLGNLNPLGGFWATARAAAWPIQGAKCREFFDSGVAYEKKKE